MLSFHEGLTRSSEGVVGKVGRPARDGGGGPAEVGIRGRVLPLAGVALEVAVGLRCHGLLRQCCGIGLC